jgi:DNA-binding transcriptional regulator YiaG
MSRQGAPTREEIAAFRAKAQERYKLNITEAQDWCAKALHTSRRTWQQWEYGERSMHPAFWELVKIKFNTLKP